MNMKDILIQLKADNNHMLIYENSYTEYYQCRLQMVKLNTSKYIIAFGECDLLNELEGEQKQNYKQCPLTHNNRLVLNKYFEYTKPKALGNKGATIGLGDRLGLASPGHIRAVDKKKIYPVLAQQSIRELTLTNRTYEDVLDAACFAVFQEGYTSGFGADGDHLKSEKDIQMSLELGFTMLTLDCIEKINNTFDDASESELESQYMRLSQEERQYYEERYLNKEFQLLKNTMTFNRFKIMKNVLIYKDAVDFMKYIFKTYIQPLERTIDFEISIDETTTPTSPEAHYFIANELYGSGVKVNSMAPRFIGEFQKGIDYIGDLGQFEKEFIIHAEIADTFGYKLSIHSGSDKFHVFPIVGKYTKGRFHVKTAGTNWLEAVRVIAKKNPELYRAMHTYALEHFYEAKKYYHVTTDIGSVKDLSQVRDDELGEYLNDDNARQLLHITYGLLLQAKDQQGNYKFKDAFYQTLTEHEEEYANHLINHIGKHIKLLGL